MKSAAIHRLETVLQSRKLDGTLALSWPAPGEGQPVKEDRLPTGLAALDAGLGGGWRRGEVSEILGAASSGRTSVLVSTLARATGLGEIAAVVDALDRFDPRSAVAAGVDLGRVLWVRGPALTVELRTRRPGHHFSGGQALAAVLNQSIRAFDLILRAGGFGVVALDLADLPVPTIRTLPWTTWLRLAHVNEGRKTVALLIGQARMGKSARGASIQLESSRIWTGTSAQSRRFQGLEISEGQRAEGKGQREGEREKVRG
jgi:recombination protein RecA